MPMTTRRASVDDPWAHLRPPQTDHRGRASALRSHVEQPFTTLCRYSGVQTEVREAGIERRHW
jgi:hypothetical protein